ncbi:MAG: hypothetical protein PHT98_13960, partial [Kiritimatiellae bacterium]|nr:hypothetical protein [Kiritimatiellia bacterium]
MGSPPDYFCVRAVRFSVKADAGMTGRNPAHAHRTNSLNGKTYGLSNAMSNRLVAGGVAGV